jgi:hypothetical protein
MKSAIFAVLMFVVARQMGWSLSRSVLYPGPAILAYPLSIAWGVFVAVVVYGPINAGAAWDREVGIWLPLRGLCSRSGVWSSC